MAQKDTNALLLGAGAVAAFMFWQKTKAEAAVPQVAPSYSSSTPVYVTTPAAPVIDTTSAAYLTSVANAVRSAMGTVPAGCQQTPYGVVCPSNFDNPSLNPKPAFQCPTGYILNAAGTACIPEPIVTPPTPVITPPVTTTPVVTPPVVTTPVVAPPAPVIEPVHAIDTALENVYTPNPPAEYEWACYLGKVYRRPFGYAPGVLPPFGGWFETEERCGPQYAEYCENGTVTRKPVGSPGTLCSSLSGFDWMRMNYIG